MTSLKYIRQTQMYTTDDTSICYTDTNIDIVHKVLNVELEKLNTWFKVNKLSLNVDKTN